VKSADARFYFIIDSLEYRNISSAEAMIHFCTYPIKTAFPRNYVVFCGNPARVTHLVLAGFKFDIKTTVIPYSILSICGDGKLPGLSSIAFEFGSQLRSIGAGTFSFSSLTAILIPDSVHFIGSSAFSCNPSIASVYFDRCSSLRPLESHTFSLRNLSVITIPKPAKEIHDYAFRECLCLRRVTFEFPSQCWRLFPGAFRDLSLLDPTFRDYDGFFLLGFGAHPRSGIVCFELPVRN
jgi:hypothetical protein